MKMSEIRAQQKAAVDEVYQNPMVYFWRTMAEQLPNAPEWVREDVYARMKIRHSIPLNLSALLVLK